MFGAEVNVLVRRLDDLDVKVHDFQVRASLMVNKMMAEHKSLTNELEYLRGQVEKKLRNQSED